MFLRLFIELRDANALFSLKMRTLLISTLALLAACGKQATVAAPSRIDPSIQRDFRDGESMVVQMRKEVGAQDNLNAATVWVVSWGGIPGTQARGATVGFRDGPGRWRFEQVRAHQNGGESFSKPVLLKTTLNAAAAAELDALVSDPRLYAEPALIDAHCTDQPLTIISVHFDGHAHQTELLGCATGMTAAVADIASGAFAKR
jgi:hypothetical protein